MDPATEQLIPDLQHLYQEQEGVSLSSGWLRQALSALNPAPSVTKIATSLAALHQRHKKACRKGHLFSLLRIASTGLPIELILIGYNYMDRLQTTIATGSGPAADKALETAVYLTNHPFHFFCPTYRRSGRSRDRHSLVQQSWRPSVRGH